MFGKVIFLLALALGVFYTESLEKSKRTKVTILYEAYCDCSRDFITKEFYPAYLELKDYLNVELVPYGTTKYLNESGTLHFFCKSEPNKEYCYANRIHACVASYKLPDEITVEFVNCMIASSNYTDGDINDCAVSTNIDFNKLQECTKEENSNSILAYYRNITNTFPFMGLPGIVFNDNFKPDLDERAKKNFKKVACEVLAHNAPEACSALRPNYTS